VKATIIGAHWSGRHYGRKARLVLRLKPEKGRIRVRSYDAGSPRAFWKIVNEYPHSVIVDSSGHFDARSEVGKLMNAVTSSMAYPPSSDPRDASSWIGLEIEI